MFKSIFTNSFGILFSRIFGLIRDILMASVLGANIYTDIFFIAFKLPNLFRRIFAEGAFSQTFIPAFTRSRHKAVFGTKVFINLFGVIAIMTLLVNIFPLIATKSIGLGFDDETLLKASKYVVINFYYLMFIFSVTFISALLQYKHHFATTAFSTALLNLSLIAALLISQNEPKEQIVLFLSYGVVVGGVLQLLTHIIALRVLGLDKLFVGAVRYFKKKSLHVKAETIKFRREFLPAIWGNSAAQISAFIDTWLATFLVTGSISYLYYANRVFQLPLALFAIATSVAIFPKIAKYLKHNQEKQALSMMQKALYFLSATLIISTITGLIFSNEIVWLLLERGAFNAKDSLQTANVLSMYLLGLLPFGLSKLFSLWLYASRMQKEAAKIATYIIAVNIGLSLLFLEPLGAMGLALASSLSGLLGLILTLKIFGKNNIKALFSKKYTLYLLLLSTISTLILFALKELLHVYI